MHDNLHTAPLSESLAP